MTPAPRSSRVANAGAILAAVTCVFVVLYAATSVAVILPIIVVTGILAIAVCGLGAIVCLATGRPGVGRAVVGGACILVPGFLMTTMT